MEQLNSLSKVKVVGSKDRSFVSQTCVFTLGSPTLRLAQEVK